MLYLIGTGLYYLTDISLRGLEELKKCDEIYLERYTNLNDISALEKIENTVGKKIVSLEREDVEGETVLKNAGRKNVALLVPGDPLSATTHIALITACKEKEIKYSVIHSSSIFTAVAETGLSLYKFGATCSVPIYTDNFTPDSFFDTIKANLEIGLHTLVLLEAKSENEFVDAGTAVSILKNIEKKRSLKIIDWDKVICLSRLGSPEQRISFTDEKTTAMPPASLVISGILNTVEKENLKSLVPAA